MFDGIALEQAKPERSYTNKDRSRSRVLPRITSRDTTINRVRGEPRHDISNQKSVLSRKIAKSQMLNTTVMDLN
jgi:hypothetical protein